MRLLASYSGQASAGKKNPQILRMRLEYWHTKIHPHTQMYSYVLNNHHTRAMLPFRRKLVC